MTQASGWRELIAGEMSHGYVDLTFASLGKHIECVLIFLNNLMYA